MVKILREYGLLILAVGALLAVSLLSLYSLNQMSVQGQSIYENGVERLQSLSKLKLELQTQHGLVAAAPAELNLANIEKNIEIIDSAKNGIKEQLLLLESGDVTRKGEENASLTDLYNQYIKNAHQVFKYAQVFAQKQASESFENDVQPVFLKLTHTLDIIYQQNQKTAQNTVLNMNNVAANMQKYIMVIGVVLVVFIVLIGGYLGLLQARSKQATKNVLKDVQHVLEDVKDLSLKMIQQATSMSESANQAGQNIASTASATQHTSSSMNSVSAAVEELSATTVEISNEAGDSVKIAEQAISETQNANEIVHEMRESVLQINQFISLITEIAEQTNLLALNAAIEAARAGDAGRGFAVVADEVRKLSGQTNDAAKDIVEQVNSITKISEEITQSIGKTTTTVTHMNEISKKVGLAVEEQNRATSDISHSISEVTSSMDSITNDVEVVSHVSEDVEKSAINIKTHITMLSEKSSELQEKLDQFVRRLSA